MLEDVSKYEEVEPLGEWNPASYHEEKGYSASQLKEAEKSLRLFYRRYVAKVADPRWDTNSLLLGDLVHVSILEPENLKSRYAVKPTFDVEFFDAKGKPAKNPMATKQYKDMLAEWEASLTPGCKVVTREQWDTASKMVESFRNHMFAADAIDCAEMYEQAYRWRDHGRKLGWRVKFDALNTGNGEILDIKTCYDASPQAFVHNVHKYRYIGSAAMYSLAYRVATGEWPERFLLIAVANQEPYDVAVYDIMEHIDLGFQWFNHQADRVAQATESDDWSEKHEAGINNISLKPWMLQDYAA